MEDSAQFGFAGAVAFPGRGRAEPDSAGLEEEGDLDEGLGEGEEGEEELGGGDPLDEDPEAEDLVSPLLDQDAPDSAERSDRHSDLARLQALLEEREAEAQQEEEPDEDPEDFEALEEPDFTRDSFQEGQDLPPLDLDDMEEEAAARAAAENAEAAARAAADDAEVLAAGGELPACMAEGVDPIAAEVEPPADEDVEAEPVIETAEMSHYAAADAAAEADYEAAVQEAEAAADGELELAPQEIEMQTVVVDVQAPVEASLAPGSTGEQVRRLPAKEEEELRVRYLRLLERAAEERRALDCTLAEIRTLEATLGLQADDAATADEGIDLKGALPKQQPAGAASACKAKATAGPIEAPPPEKRPRLEEPESLDV